MVRFAACWQERQIVGKLRVVSSRKTVLSWTMSDEPFPIPIDGVLGLHTFQPRDVGQLVPEYLEACRQKGILQVRIVHGKGTGTLQRTVHALLARHPQVLSFTLDHPEYGGWGATLIALKPKSTC